VVDTAVIRQAFGVSRKGRNIPEFERNGKIFMLERSRNMAGCNNADE